MDDLRVVPNSPPGLSGAVQASPVVWPVLCPGTGHGAQRTGPLPTPSAVKAKIKLLKMANLAFLSPNVRLLG